MRFTLKIDMDNAAFKDNNTALKLKHILNTVRAQLDDEDENGAYRLVFDSNGNPVGFWEIKGARKNRITRRKV